MNLKGIGGEIITQPDGDDLFQSSERNKNTDDNQ